MSVENIKVALRDEIFKQLKEKNMSQAQLAKMMGQDRQQIGNALKTQFEKTSINRLVELLEHLNVEVKPLFLYREGTSSPDEEQPR